MAGVSSDLGGLLGLNTPSPGGATSTSTMGGKAGSPGSGPKHQQGMSSAQVAAAVVPHPGAQPRPKAPPQPKMPKKPQFSASNPQMMVQPPPQPHPGVRPPYPDARSPQPVLQPNGVPVMPMPPGHPAFGPRVPTTFAPGMTGLLGR